MSKDTNARTALIELAYRNPRLTHHEDYFFWLAMWGLGLSEKPDPKEWGEIDAERADRFLKASAGDEAARKQLATEHEQYLKQLSKEIGEVGDKPDPAMRIHVLPRKNERYASGDEID